MIAGEKIMLERYIVLVGVVLFFIGIAELVWPEQAFVLWRKWVRKKGFFLHGAILIAGGFPLTIYDGRFSPLIFIAGLIAVLTGPFILIYPDKIRDAFESIDKETGSGSTKKIMVTEALIRITVGVTCAASFIINRLS